MMRGYNGMAVVAALMLAAACSPEASRVEPERATATEGVSDMAAQMPSLAGQWHVAAINGREISGVTIKGTDKSLFWEPGCAGQSINYRQAEGGTEFFNDPSADAQEVCDIGFPQEVPLLWEMLSGTKSLTLNADGSVLVTGGDKTVLLTPRQEPVPPAITSLAGMWRVTAIDGYPTRFPLVLEADDDAIWWNPRCAGMVRSYTIDGETIAIGPDKQASRPADPVSPPPPVCAIGIPPYLDEVVAILKLADRIDPAADGGVTLSGRESGKARSVLLTRE